MRCTRVVLGLGTALALSATACGAGLEARPGEDAAPVATTAAPAPGDDAAEIDAAAVDAEVEADGPLRQVVLDAVDETSAAGSGRYEMLIMFDGTTAASDIPIAQVRATGEYAETGIRHTLEVSPDQEAVDETVVGGRLYSEHSNGVCASMELSDPMAQRRPGEREIDPTSVLEELHGIRAEVTDLGPLRIQDTRTTHYATTLTRREAIEAAPDELDAMLLGLDEAFLDVPQQVDLFVDDSGLLRRVQVLTPAYEGVGTPLPAFTTIVDLRDLGDDIVIEAPADCDEVRTEFQTVPVD